jgi:hypothetical protein
MMLFMIRKELRNLMDGDNHVSNHVSIVAPIIKLLRYRFTYIMFGNCSLILRSIIEELEAEELKQSILTDNHTLTEAFNPYIIINNELIYNNVEFRNMLIKLGAIELPRGPAGMSVQADNEDEILKAFN